MKSKVGCARSCTLFARHRPDAKGWSSLAVMALVALTLSGRGQAQNQNPLLTFQWEATLGPATSGDPYPQGTNTVSNMVEVKPGVFVGTAQGGGPQPQYSACPANMSWNNAGCGTIYQIDTTTLPNPTITVLWAFTGGTDGAQPTGRIDWDGTYVYGTTQGSGICPSKLAPPYCGTIYRFNPKTSALTTIYSMQPLAGLPYGLTPVTGVVYDKANGHLYGTTSISDTGWDSIFDLASAHTVVAAMPNFFDLVPSHEGSTLQALMLYTDGNLYGATRAGGSVIQFDTTSHAITECASATVTVNGVTGGSLPIGQLAAGSDGALYGTGSGLAFSPGAGLIFRVDVSGGCAGAPLKVIHLFGATDADLGNPQAGMLSAGGLLYGTAIGVAVNNAGGIYSLTASTSDTEQQPYAAPFTATPALEPHAELTLGSDGFIYGTTVPGSIFRFYPPPRHVFQYGTTGVADYGYLIATDAKPNSINGPRTYIAGVSNSNLTGIYGGHGSGGFYVGRLNADQTLDVTFNATNNANNNGGFLQFGPGPILSGSSNSFDAMAVDYLGNILLAGTTNSGVFNCTIVTGTSNIWIASITPEGFAEWCTVFGSTKSDSVGSLTLDAAGNVYVTGLTDGNMPGNTLQGSQDAFIAKINRQGSHGVTVYEFAQAGQSITSGLGIAYCKGYLYLSGSTGAPYSFISKYNASSFSTGALFTSQLAAGYYARPVATDSACNAYLGSDQYQSNSPPVEHFALQKYDASLNLKWEADGTVRNGFAPEYILSVAADPTGAIYAAGGTDYSLYGLPLPTNCDINGGTVLFCAGWFAAYEPVHGHLIAHSAVEYGDVATAFDGLAVDMYGNPHVAGTTVGPLTSTAQYDNSGDAFEMDFGPTGYPSRTGTSASLSASATTVTHGTPVTFTAKIEKGGHPATGGSVTFITDGYLTEGYTVLKTVANSTGTVTYTTSGLPLGTNDVWAVYTGTSTLSPSTSIPVTVKVQ